MFSTFIWSIYGIVAHPTFHTDGMASSDLVSIQPTSLRLSVASHPTYYVSWSVRQQPNVLLAGCPANPTVHRVDIQSVSG